MDGDGLLEIGRDVTLEAVTEAELAAEEEYEERCRARPGESADAPLRLYMDTVTPPSSEMKRWPSCLRQCLRDGLVRSAEDRSLGPATL